MTITLIAVVLFDKRTISVIW